MTSDLISQPEFRDTRGHLPDFWPHRVTFFANLLALFFGNESQTQSLAREVGEIDSYGARLIPVLDLLFRGESSGGSNLLVLERSPDDDLCRYLAEDLGLSLPELHVLSHRDYTEIGRALAGGDCDAVTQQLAAVAAHDSQWLDGYVTDSTLAAIARHLNRQTLSTTAASRAGNNKLMLHQFLESRQLPVFDTVLAAGPQDVPRCAAELLKLGYQRGVLRAQIGASGIGMLIFPDLSRPDAFPPVPEHLFFEGPCLVQGWIAPGIADVTAVHSPSTQLFVNDTAVAAFDLTEQILSHDSIHEGNESPPEYLDHYPGLRDSMMTMAEAAGTWLHSTGYRGTASIDWLIVERSGRSIPQVYVCEINARVTGATYPSLLARHFRPHGAWLLRNLRLRTPLTPRQLLQLFDTPGHLFRPDRDSGIIPLNLNFGSDNLVHKGQFLCLGDSTAQCHEFLTLAERDLPVQWSPDRD